MTRVTLLRQPPTAVQLAAWDAADAASLSDTAAVSLPGSYTNDPGGGIVQINRPMSVQGASADDLVGLVTWWYDPSPGSVVIVTDETGQNISAPDASKCTFVNGQENGPPTYGVQYQDFTPSGGSMASYYWACDIKVSSNWNNTLGILKLFWFIGDGSSTGTPAMIIKLDGDSAPYVRYTSETDAGVTYNSSSMNFSKGVWHTVEGIVTYQYTTNVARLQMWLDGSVDSFDETMMCSGTYANDVQIGPYIGGKGTLSPGVDIDLFYGDWFVRRLS